MLECPTCGATKTAHGDRFESKHALRIHHTKAHREPLEADDLTKCPTCGEYFETERGMNHHHSMVHDVSLVREAAVCVECGEEFEYYPSAHRGKFCSDCSHVGDHPYGRTKRNRERLQEVKEDELCINCQEQRSQILDFHHVEGSKTDDVSQMMDKTWEEIEAEVEKCVTLCKNCHALVHNGLLDVEALL